jgi:hypothetical protein
VTITHQPPDVGTVAGETWVVVVALPCGCGAGCDFAAAACWGQVEAVEEHHTDDDSWWTHACERHAEST